MKAAIFLMIILAVAVIGCATQPESTPQTTTPESQAAVETTEPIAADTPTQPAATTTTPTQATSTVGTSSGADARDLQTADDDFSAIDATLGEM